MTRNIVYSRSDDVKRRKNSNIILFVIGLFSITQLKMPGFSLCISEFYMYFVAPFLFIKNYSLLQRHGMLPFIGLGVLVSIACVVSGLANGTEVYFILKGLASTYPLFAFPVVLHNYLWRNFNGLRWLLLGVAFSSVISTFVFQTSVEVNMLAGGAEGSAAVGAIMNGPVFWIGRLKNFVTIPIYGWYLSTPMTYSVLAPLCMAAFSMLTTISGRSAAMGAIGGAIIAVLCGKTLTTMHRFCRNFPIICLAGIVCVFLANRGYRFAAINGWLGERARVKYEEQTKGSKSILKLLMGGRGEFFIGIIASLDKPLLGHGPWAIDDGGYADLFMAKYGNEEDYEKRLAAREYQYRTVGTRYSYIQSHSHIGSFWLWFGVVGLYYWVYVIFSIFRYLSKELPAVPQWAGFLAVGAPPMLWTIFFSGFGIRIYTMPYLVVLIMAHNVYKGRIAMPIQESLEIR